MKVYLKLDTGHLRLDGLLSIESPHNKEHSLVSGQLCGCRPGWIIAKQVMLRVYGAWPAEMQMRAHDDCRTPLQRPTGDAAAASQDRRSSTGNKK